MHLALRTGSDVPLPGFSEFLSSQGCAHRLGRRGQDWEIWVDHAREVPVVRRLYAEYAAQCELPPLETGMTRGGEPFLRGLLHAPFTLILLLAALGTSLATGLGRNEDLLRMFTIVDFEVLERMIRYPSLEWVAVSGEWWRLFTPTLLHFSVLHLVFNGLWLWLLGMHIERTAGTLHCMLLVLITAVLANLAQFQAGGPMFGGLSGVVFGLLAYTLLVQGHPRFAGLHLPTGLWVFAAVYIALGFTPIFSAAGIGEMANAAHLAGLATGIVAGGLHRLILQRAEPGGA